MCSLNTLHPSNSCQTLSDFPRGAEGWRVNLNPLLNSYFYHHGDHTAGGGSVKAAPQPLFFNPLRDDSSVFKVRTATQKYLKRIIIVKTGNNAWTHQEKLICWKKCPKNQGFFKIKNNRIFQLELNKNINTIKCNKICQWNKWNF